MVVCWFDVKLGLGVPVKGVLSGDCQVNFNFGTAASWQYTMI